MFSKGSLNCALLHVKFYSNFITQELNIVIKEKPGRTWWEQCGFAKTIRRLEIRFSDFR